VDVEGRRGGECRQAHVLKCMTSEEKKKKKYAKREGRGVVFVQARR
jgi:hypothetical protein